MQKCITAYWLMKDCHKAWPNEGDLLMIQLCSISTPELLRERGMWHAINVEPFEGRFLQVCGTILSRQPLWLIMVFGCPFCPP